MIGVLVTVLVSALLLIAGHYFNWPALIGQPLGRIPSYIYGVTAISVPLCLYYWLSGSVESAIALACVVFGGGASVVVCHAVDDWLLTKRRLREAEERERHLLDKIAGNEPS
jgi:hypothetical protein